MFINSPYLIIHTNIPLQSNHPYKQKNPQMFYDATNTPALNSRRSRKMFKMRTSLLDQDKYLGKYIEHSKPLYGECGNKNKKGFKKQNYRCSEGETIPAKVIRERYGNVGENGLHHLLKENQFYRQSINNHNEVQPSVGQKSNTNKTFVHKNQCFKNPYQASLMEIRKKINTIIPYSTKNRHRFSEQEYNQIISERTEKVQRMERTQRTERADKTERTNVKYNPYVPLTRRRTDKPFINSSKVKTLRQSIPQQNQNIIYYEVSSIKGTKETNQDSVKAGQNIWIVCDGHGEYGHHVSWYVSNLLYEIYLEKIGRQKFSKNILINIFSQVQKNLQQSGIDVKLSGSTCVMIVLVESKIYCACLGDSVAVVIFEDSQFEIISSDHKPSNNQQAKRIEFFGGVVKKTSGKQHIPSSPLRIWGQSPQNWGPGLAISRSFGDKMAQKYGLICQPQIKQLEVTKQLKYIVLGSDGLFDQIKPSQIGHILNGQKRNAKSDGCRALTQIAQSRWLGYSDDISGIVIYF